MPSTDVTVAADDRTVPERLAHRRKRRADVAIRAQRIVQLVDGA